MKRKIKVSTIQKAVRKARKEGKKIGFVPTMGALHEGHISLINAARKKSDVVISSIFVNPTQFNDKKDLIKYPRTLKADSRMLEDAGTDFLFHPSVDEIYPPGKKYDLNLDLKGLDTVMEGEFRPGHFKGVVQVVHRLLDIVKPDFLFMGQKDFQQFTIIQHMINTLKMPTELVVCPIIREKDGLAMSSRNRRLDPNLRKKANILYRTLKKIKAGIKDQSPSSLIDMAMKETSIPGLKPEYFAIVDGNTLQDVDAFDHHDYVVVCTAVWAGDVRLIDNMILYKP
jgi:pantoate--beta-alanine ligase